MTWERHTAEMTEEKQGNLIVWNARTGEPVTYFHQKVFVKEFWYVHSYQTSGKCLSRLC